MKVMVTSFGVERSLSSETDENTMFHRMPPVSFRWVQEAFMPDYELLLLCDSVIMDEASFDRLVQGSVAAYSHVSETFQALRSDGRIELKDFSSTLRPHAELLGRMIEHDLKSLDQWVEPLRDSLILWRDFSRMAADLVRAEREEWFDHARLRDGPHHHGYPRLQAYLMRSADHMRHPDEAIAAHMSILVTDALESSTKRKRTEYRDALRGVLRDYLTYVDANLILSHQLDVGFHDWLDFTPFYSAKFLSVGRDQDPLREGRAQLEKLFTIPFPELAIRDTRALMKALNDKRLEDLRRLVTEAIDGRVQFDDEFAKAVLREVLRSSEHAKKLRSVVGYATLPIGLIPWVGTVAQKAIEEGVGIPIEAKYKRKHRWFYMLSDIARSAEEAAER
jgi:hypothetical protein